MLTPACIVCLFCSSFPPLPPLSPTSSLLFLLSPTHSHPLPHSPTLPHSLPLSPTLSHSLLHSYIFSHPHLPLPLPSPLQHFTPPYVSPPASYSRAVIGIGVEDEDRIEQWMEDAESVRKIPHHFLLYL